MLVHVIGLPQQQGSKNPWGGEANKNLMPWRGHVKQTVGEAWIAAGLSKLLGPVELRITFAFPRPKTHYRTGKNAHILRDDAPYWKISTPDLDKLLRAIGDALKEASVYRDDAQVASVVVRKVYDETTYADIEIIDLSGGSHDESRSTAAGAGPRTDGGGTGSPLDVPLHL